MFDWMEAHSTRMIAVLVFLLCYALAAVIFLVVRAVVRRPIGADIKVLSPVTLTPLAVILGLLIAFLASRVWDNVSHAHEYVGHETGALTEVMRLSASLPDAVGAKVRASIREHVAYVETNDWPEMAKSVDMPYRASPALKAALDALFEFTTTQQREQFVREEAVREIKLAFEARRDRIRISNAEIDPGQWLVILLLASLIMVTTAFIHIDRPASALLALCIFATAVSACIVLLMAYDKPFGTGGVKISPAAYKQIALE